MHSSRIQLLAGLAGLLLSACETKGPTTSSSSANSGRAPAPAAPAPSAQHSAADESTPIEIAQCTSILDDFAKSPADAKKRFLHKEIITSGTISSTEWVANGNLKVCPYGSDGQGFVSSILCELDPATPEAEKSALKQGAVVRFSGPVDDFFSTNSISQLTIKPCVIVK